MNEEIAEKVAEQMEKQENRGGGGGRRYPKDRFGRDGKTKKTHLNEEARNKNKEILKAQKEVGDRLFIILNRETNPTSHLGLREYLEWVRYGLLALQEDPREVVRNQDLKLEFTRSGGPGGQNVNKVSTAVRIVHRPSQMQLKEEGSRSQEDNRTKAEERIYEKLLRHLESWGRLVGDKDMGEVIAGKLAEAILGRQFKPKEEGTLEDIRTKLKEHRNLI